MGRAHECGAVEAGNEFLVGDGSGHRPTPIRIAQIAPEKHGELPRWLTRIFRPVRWRHVIVLALVLLYPFVATPFFTFQIGAQSLALGLIALSLTFLGGYAAWSPWHR